MTDAIWRLCMPPSTVGRPELHSDVAEFLAEYADATVGGLELGAMAGDLTEVIHRNRLLLPPGASLLLRMLWDLEATAKLLNPSFQLLDLVEPYAKKAARQRYAPLRISRRLSRGMREWERLLRSLPADLDEMVQAMRAGTFSVHLDHRRLDPVVNRLVLGLLTSSLLLGSSLLWSLHAEPLVRGVSLFGAIGYALALVMGARLLLRIGRSEQPRRNR